MMPDPLPPMPTLPLAGKRVAVVVLGEIGQSPRMRHHATSLADVGATVDLIAYCGAATPASLRDNVSITLHPLPEGWSGRHRLKGVAFTLYSVLRVFVSALRLFGILGLRMKRPDAILLQTPPALPTLPIALLAGWVRRASVLIDWHNYGHALLALKSGKGSRAVRFYRWSERVFGRRGSAHLTVSQAMADDISTWLTVPPPVVFRDMPPSEIGAAAAQGRYAARQNALTGFPELHQAMDKFEGTAKLLVSPTSWSRDEDMSPLLEAAATYDARARENRNLPPLVFALTGEGPGREAFIQAAADRELERVAFVTGWLAFDVYAALLAGADAGVSLHNSASGLDLPMKVADMIAAGLPVFAFDYGPVLREMLGPEYKVAFFTDAEELADAFERELADGALGVRVGAPSVRSWHDEWCDAALPLIARHTGGER